MTMGYLDSHPLAGHCHLGSPVRRERRAYRATRGLRSGPQQRVRFSVSVANFGEGSRTGGQGAEGRSDPPLRGKQPTPFARRQIRPQVKPAIGSP
jgi:hypothetical protein